MNRLLFSLLMVLSFHLVTTSAFASRAYVTDSFEITLRTGASTEHRVIATPISGQLLEVLESQEGWSRVRLPGESGKEGWVQNRYLITRQPWEMQANTLREENMVLRDKIAASEKKGNVTIREKEKLGTDFQTATERLRQLQLDYESLKRGSENYLKLKAAHDATQSSLKTTRAELQRLISENEQLRSSQINRWFATGALVLLCGLLIGLITGRQQRKRRALYG